jgi:hypothetical protein
MKIATLIIFINFFLIGLVYGTNPYKQECFSGKDSVLAEIQINIQATFDHSLLKWNYYVDTFGRGNSEGMAMI